ncbi:MAG TPA: hypothetical protein VK983_01890 [Candidatus Limnocylindrales bacterium]|nr:hypothetical protein [Candidatus Limnocylindrales bacterium]
MSKKLVKKVRKPFYMVLVVAILTFVGSGDLYMWALNRMMMD